MLTNDMSALIIYAKLKREVWVNEKILINYKVILFQSPYYSEGGL